MFALAPAFAAATRVSELQAKGRESPPPPPSRVQDRRLLGVWTQTYTSISHRDKSAVITKVRQGGLGKAATWKRVGYQIYVAFHFGSLTQKCHDHTCERSYKHVLCHTKETAAL